MTLIPSTTTNSNNSYANTNAIFNGNGSTNAFANINSPTGQLHSLRQLNFGNGQQTGALTNGHTSINAGADATQLSNIMNQFASLVYAYATSSNSNATEGSPLYIVNDNSSWVTAQGNTNTLTIDADLDSSTVLQD